MQIPENYTNPLMGQERYQFNFYIQGTYDDKSCVVKATVSNDNRFTCIEMPYALKCYRRDLFNVDRRRVRKEVLALMGCKSIHIVRFYEVFLSYSHICIVLEFLDGGNLRDRIKTYQEGMDEMTARNYYIRVLLAVRDAHSAGIKNRDIKAQNVVCASRRRVVKLCDFGFAKNVYSICRTRLGTLAYMAPEVLSLSYYNDENEQYDGKKVDIWALGVLLYYMLFNMFPFEIGDDDSNTHSRLDSQKICIYNTNYVLHKEITVDCRKILRRMLEKAPALRATAEELLEHPWVRDAQELSSLNVHLNAKDYSCQDKDQINNIFNKAVIWSADGNTMDLIDD